MIGIIATIMGLVLSTRGTVKGGGLVMIGPIPIIFGNDPRLLKFVMIMALIIMLVFLLPLFFRLAR